MELLAWQCERERSMKPLDFSHIWDKAFGEGRQNFQHSAYHIQADQSDRLLLVQVSR